MYISPIHIHAPTTCKHISHTTPQLPAANSKTNTNTARVRDSKTYFFSKSCVELEPLWQYCTSSEKRNEKLLRLACT